MSKPLTVSVPHELGRLEARRRIDQGIGRFTDQFGQSAQVEKTWTGDKLSFNVQAMGQTVFGFLNVQEDKVDIEVTLPGFLSMIGGKIKGKLEKEGQILLEKK